MAIKEEATAKAVDRLRYSVLPTAAILVFAALLITLLLLRSYLPLDLKYFLNLLF